MINTTSVVITSSRLQLRQVAKLRSAAAGGADLSSPMTRMMLWVLGLGFRGCAGVTGILLV